MPSTTTLCPPHDMTYNARLCKQGEPIEVAPSDADDLRAAGWTDHEPATKPKPKKASKPHADEPENTTAAAAADDQEMSQ